MRRRIVLTVLMPALVALALATPVGAGCCAIITLDQLPTQVVAGQPTQISFMYRINHMPLTGYTLEINATHANTSDSFTVIAEQQERTGHYAATLTFPIAGEWRWSIMRQPMPPLTVLPAAPPGRANTSLPLAAGVVGLAGSAVALLISLRPRRRAHPAARSPIRRLRPSRAGRCSWRRVASCAIDTNPPPMYSGLQKSART